eukprot:758662-Hanusia_phi.AAC.2
MQEGNAEKFGRIVAYNKTDGIYTIRIIDTLSITTSVFTTLPNSHMYPLSDFAAAQKVGYEPEWLPVWQ